MQQIDRSAQNAWQALRQLPAARYLALAMPGFCRGRPMESALTRSSASNSKSSKRASRQPPWGNSAVLTAVLLGQHVQAAGAGVVPARQLNVDNLPLRLWTEADGDTVAQPCTEVLRSDRAVERVQAQGFIPVLQPEGRADLRLGGFVSLAGTPLAGRWAGPA